MSTRLKLHDADQSLDPYSNFEAAAQHKTDAFDMQDFSLRMQNH